MREDGRLELVEGGQHYNSMLVQPDGERGFLTYRKQHLVLFALAQAFVELGDGPRLAALGLHVGDQAQGPVREELRAHGVFGVPVGAKGVHEGIRELVGRRHRGKIARNRGGAY